VHERSENGVVVSGWRRVVLRLGAAAGIAGPAAFAVAWIASSLRQTRHGPGGLQLSGLAAPDARDPWIMLAGFVVLGGCTVAFGAALRRALRGTARGGAGCGPVLIQCAGLLTVAAGLLRRDHLLLNAPVSVRPIGRNGHARACHGPVMTICPADSRLRAVNPEMRDVPYAPPAVMTISVTNPAASPSKTPQYSNSLRPFLCATPSS
jgi:hypothetical protein